MRSDARKRLSQRDKVDPQETTEYLVTVCDSDNHVIAQVSRESDPGFLTNVTVTPVVK